MFAINYIHCNCMHCLQDYATGSVEANMYTRAKQLRKLLTNLGPSFVKVGQALSSRPDLMPKPYLEVRTMQLVPYM